MSLSRNIIANYLGRGWEALIGLAFVPLYIQYLGVEAWGLVGFMVMMQAWFAILDMGLAPALSREMARFTAGAHTAESIRDLLRSLEAVYSGIALAVLVLVWFAAPWVAVHWLNPEHLSPEIVSQSLLIMGVVLAARMAEQVYRGAILGLQRMVWLSGAQAGLATLRWAGAMAVLVWVEPTIQAFFLWQGTVSLISILVLAGKTYQYLPKTIRSARFDWSGLLAIRSFAGGMAIISLLALLLTQVDKLLLSKLVPLSEFGIYTLAATVAGAISLLTIPISTALLPRLTELVAREDKTLLVGTYHRASQWLAVVLVPTSLVLAVFSEQLLWVWTNDAALARQAGPLLTLLALGTMMNGFMHVPFMAQLAYGWTGFAVRVNAVAVAIIVPVILWAVPRYGAVAAAWVWLGLNTGYVLISIHFMHRRILCNEKWLWYARAVGVPVLVSGLSVVCLRLSLPADLGRMQLSAYLVLSTTVVTIFTAFTTQEPLLTLKRLLGIKEKVSDE